MNGHKREADTATETTEEKKKGKWDHRGKVQEEEVMEGVKGEEEEGRRSALTSQSAHEAECIEETEKQNKLPCSGERRNPSVL